MIDCVQCTHWVSHTEQSFGFPLGSKCPCPGRRDGSGSFQLCPSSSHLHRSCTHLPTLMLVASISWDHTELSALKQSQNIHLCGCSWCVSALLQSPTPNPALAFYFAFEKTTAKLAQSLYTSACLLPFTYSNGTSCYMKSNCWLKATHSSQAEGKRSGGICRKGRSCTAVGRLISRQWCT